MTISVSSVEKTLSEFSWRGVPIRDNQELLDTMLLILRSGSQMDAMDLIDEYASYLRSLGTDEPYAIAQSNLGYMVGYLGKEDTQSVYEFFNLSHPILGNKPWELSTEEIFKKGIEWGEAMKEGRAFP